MDEVPQQLELLVEGELGLAVLNGLFVVFYEAFDEILATGGPDRIKHVFDAAKREAGRLAIPRDVPAEVRAEWRHTAIEAIFYFRDYMPAFIEPRDGEPE